MLTNCHPLSVRRVCLIESEILVKDCDRLPSILGRASRVSSLISSCGLRPHLSVLSPRLARHEDLCIFHSRDYIDFLLEVSRSKDPEQLEEEAAKYGLDFDCPAIPRLYELCLGVAGATITAAEALTEDFDVALNWLGGWHHAQRDSAEGFCYVNDIVLGIHELRRKFDKVLYVDLDVHHGNGVENAFLFSPKVFTLSLHLKEAGFYPGSGGLQDVGLGRGRNFCMNLPLLEGVSDETYMQVFHKGFHKVLTVFQPDVIVCQCGSDSLSRDPLGGFNLTPVSVLECVKSVLSTGLPVLLLGGGGYVTTSAAKLWTILTALAVQREELLPNEIPEEDAFFLEYGPSYDFEFSRGRQKDRNSEESVLKLLTTIEEFSIA